MNQNEMRKAVFMGVLQAFGVLLGVVVLIGLCAWRIIAVS